jgi:hypothetical protein
MAGGLPHYVELNEPVRQTRLLAGPPVYEPAPLAARERGFARHLGMILFARRACFGQARNL